MNPETEELRKRRSEPQEMTADGSDEDEIDSIEQPVSSNGFPVIFGDWSLAKEKKGSSILVRVISGFAILFAFIGIVYMGHYPVIMLITAIQVGFHTTFKCSLDSSMNC